MRITQFINSKTEKSVKNQFCIMDGNTETFQSYNSKIATIDYKNKTLTIGGKWGFSATTMKYFCDWLTQVFDADPSFKKHHIETMLELGFCGDYKVIFDFIME